MIKKILLCLGLLLLGGVAFADTAPDVLNPDAVSRYTDMSVYYLSQLFGTVGNVLTSGESQMMGKLFYQLNWGIFLISSIVIFYSVLMGTLKLASEGVTMQPGKSALFSLVKLAVGISLVIPSASTGYCVMQEIVMQVVVKGVGLADSVWGAGLDYLDKGGSVWHNPGNSKPTDIIDGFSISALLGQDKLASQIFQNEVCMIGSRDPIPTTSTAPSNTIAADSTSRPYFDVQEKDTQMLYDFPGLTDDNISTGNACGTVSWNVNNSCKDGFDSTNCAISRNAMSKLIYTLLPAAKAYYCSLHGSRDSCLGFDGFSGKSSNEGLAPYLVNSLLGYFPSIKAYADSEMNKQQANQTAFVQKAKLDGWIVAGRYYWDVMRITRQSDQATSLSNYAFPDRYSGPTNYSMVGGLKDIIDSAKPDFNKSLTSQYFQQNLDAVLVTSDKLNPKGNLISKSAVFNKTSYGLTATTIFNPGVNATLVLVMAKLDDIGGMFGQWDKYHYNPIEFLYKLGQKCINLTLLIWLAGGVMIAGGMLLTSFCAAASPLAYAANAVTEWVKPIIMMIAVTLWMAGFFLSYYVPLYPFMVFLFASFGWFISVIEAMVAAPLVALGMTHPETHDLLGKSEQGIMLLLSVFIQPTLLVIGLMGGIILSYVSFELLIYTYSGFVVDILNSSGPQTAVATNVLAAVQNSPLYNSDASWKGANLLVAPMLLIVFCAITYTLLTQSFSLIYLLRDNVMKWIGVSSTGIPSVEQMLSDTRGTVSQAGSRTADAGSQGAGAINSASQTAGANQRDNKEKENKKKENDVTVPEGDAAKAAAGGV